MNLNSKYYIVTKAVRLYDRYFVLKGKILEEREVDWGAEENCYAKIYPNYTFNFKNTNKIFKKIVFSKNKYVFDTFCMSEEILNQLYYSIFDYLEKIKNDKRISKAELKAISIPILDYLSKKKGFIREDEYIELILNLGEKLRESYKDLYIKNNKKQNIESAKKDILNYIDNFEVDIDIKAEIIEDLKNICER